MFEYLNYYPESAKAHALKVYEIEKALAQNAMNAEEQREVQKLYNPRTKNELIKNYPVALYEGEIVGDLNKPGNPKIFAKPLTVELLAEHQEFFKAAK